MIKLVPCVIFLSKCIYCLGKRPVYMKSSFKLISASFISYITTACTKSSYTLISKETDRERITFMQVCQIVYLLLLQTFTQC